MVEPHAHISPVHMLASLAFTILALGTIHLLALSSDTRISRAFLALGF